jgi:hypothetical protein
VTVIPAKAGIQPFIRQMHGFQESWIPAFAGMTSGENVDRFCHFV